MAIKRNIGKFIFKALVVLLTVVIIITGALIFLAYKYRDQVAGKIIVMVKNRYGVDLKYETLGIGIFENWPQVSINLNDANLTFLKTENKKPFLIAGDLSVSMNAVDLLNGRIRVNDVKLNNGLIQLDIDQLGRKNFDFKSNDDSSARVDLSIRRIFLNRIKLEFNNREKQKHLALVFVENELNLKWVNEFVLGRLEGKLESEELLAKVKKGPMFFHKKADEQINFVFLRHKKQIYIDKSSKLEIDSQEYRVGGMVFLDSLKRMELQVKARIKNFQNTVSLLNSKARKSLRYVQIVGPIDGDMFLKVKLNSNEDPEIRLKFKAEHNQAYLGSERVHYTDLNYRGQLLCLPDANGVPDMKRAQVSIDKLKGKIYGFPFRGKASIRDLNSPYLLVTARLDIDSKKIKFKPGKDFDLHGFCYADIRYEGPTENMSNKTFLNAPMKLRGQLNIDHVTYKTSTNKLPFVLNGKAQVFNHDVSFKDLLLITNGGSLHLKGKATEFTPYLYDLNNGFKAEVEAWASTYNLTPLIENTLPKKNRDSMISQKKGIVKTLSKNDFEFNLKIKIDRLLLRRVQMENALANVHYEDDVINLSKLQLKTCDGALSGSGWLYNYSKVMGHVYLKGMDIQKLFTQCENFGQDAITADNLSGIISASTNIAIQFSESFRPDIHTLALDAETDLRDGHLLHYEPLKKISRYIFRKRNFDDITFTEMKPTFTIRGAELKLDTMEIASNVMNVLVNGVYNFKGESNFNFMLPWSNLKPRGKDYEPHPLIPEGQLGRGLKLNLHGYPHDMKLSLGNK